MQKLKWSTIEQRRIWTDVTLMYKEVSQLKALKADPISYQPSLATVRGTRNSHCLKFVPHHCRINVYQLLFFPWIIYHWNTLPESIILSPLLEQFRTSTSIQNLQHWTTCPAYLDTYSDLYSVYIWTLFHCTHVHVVSSPINVRNAFLRQYSR